MRWDSAAIVLKTSELLPEPETPVNTVSRRFGISTLTFLRLFSRAPCTRMRSWLSAGWVLEVAIRAVTSQLRALSPVVHNEASGNDVSNGARSSKREAALAKSKRERFIP